MKNIIKFELLKIVTSKLFIYTLLVFTLMDVFVLIYTGNVLKQDEIPYSSYRLLNEQLKTLTKEQKKQLIEEQEEKNSAFSIIDTIRNLQNSENEAMVEYSKILREENQEITEKYMNQYQNAEYPYTKDASKELAFWKEIKQEFEETERYQETINTILTKAEELETISVFQESINDFSSQNIKDTAKQYEKMLPTKIDYQPAKGIECFTKMGITDILMILFIFIISSIMVLEEKQKNLLMLIKSTKEGRIKTMVGKIIVMGLLIIGFSSMLYLIQFVYYGITIGYGNLGASLQSINTFLFSTLPINIGEYLLLFLGTKMIVFFIVSLIILLISIFAKNSVTTYIAVIAVFLISFWLYQAIDPGSSFQVIKYINIINLLETNGIYKTYFNLKIGNSREDVLTLSIIFGIILLFSLILGIIFLFDRKRDLTTKDSRLLSKVKNFTILKLKIATKVFTHELYKLFITNKVAIFLIAFMIFQIVNLNTASKTVSFSENTYKNYMKLLEGKLTSEKVKFIEEENKKFVEAEMSIKNIEEKQQKGELSKQVANRYKEPYEDMLSTQEIFNRVLAQYEYIKENPEAEFVYDTGYKELLRVNKNAFIENDLYLVVISIICFTSLFVIEYRTGMIHLLNTTPKGRKYTAKSKIVVCIIAGVMIFLITSIPEIIQIEQIYGLSRITTSIISLSYFQGLPVEMSILAFMIIMYLLRLIGLISIILVILWISLKVKNSTYAILIASAILLIPMILVFLGISFANSFTIIPVLNVSKIILAGGKQHWFYIIIPILIGCYCYWNLGKKFV